MTSLEQFNQDMAAKTVGYVRKMSPGKYFLYVEFDRKPRLFDSSHKSFIAAKDRAIEIGCGCCFMCGHDGRVIL